MLPGNHTLVRFARSILHPSSCPPVPTLAPPQVKAYAARVQEEGQPAGEESYEGAKVGA